MGRVIAVGDLAPEFSLKDQAGKVVRLSDFRGKSWVVLYFYPKDDTPGCTAEACAFRDAYTAFSDAGAQVLGVSSDSVESHAAFAVKHRLPFSLLSDPGAQLRRQYGVKDTLGLLPGRVTYLIDPSGVVRHFFSSQFRIHKHIDEALKLLQGK